MQQESVRHSVREVKKNWLEPADGLKKKKKISDRQRRELRSTTARTLWKKGESSAPSVFHAFLGAICERALNLYVCRGGAL